MPQNAAPLPHTPTGFTAEWWLHTRAPLLWRARARLAAAVRGPLERLLWAAEHWMSPPSQVSVDGDRLTWEDATTLVVAVDMFLDRLADPYYLRDRGRVGARYVLESRRLLGALAPYLPHASRHTGLEVASAEDEEMSDVWVGAAQLSRMQALVAALALDLFLARVPCGGRGLALQRYYAHQARRVRSLLAPYGFPPAAPTLSLASNADGVA